MAENLKAVEKPKTDVAMIANALVDVTSRVGWQYILDIIEQRLIDAEFQLLNYNEPNEIELRRLHTRARTMREFFDKVQSDIRTVITSAEPIPAPKDLGDTWLDEPKVTSGQSLTW